MRDNNLHLYKHSDFTTNSENDANEQITATRKQEPSKEEIRPLKNEFLLRQHNFLWILYLLNSHDLSYADDFKGAATKWKEFVPKTIRTYDHRTVIKRELIFDIDADAWHKVRELGNQIIKALNNLQIPHLIGVTGGKGIHIHVLFKLDEDQEEILNDKGLTFRDLRVFLHRYICEAASINSEIVGVSKTIDTAVIDWSDQGKGHLIRCFGGRKTNSDGQILGYKTLVHEIPETKPLIKSETACVLPKTNDIKFWLVPEKIFAKFLRRFSKKKETPTKRHELHDETDTNNGDSCLSLSKPCVQAILKSEGIHKGNRHNATITLALAMKLAGVPKHEAVSKISKLWRDWNKLGDRHQESDIRAWINSMYRNNYNFCGIAKKYGFCKSNECNAGGYIAKAVKAYEKLRSEIDLTGGDNDNIVLDTRKPGVGKTTQALEGSDRVIYCASNYEILEEKADKFNLKVIYGRTHEIDEGSDKYFCKYGKALESVYSKLGKPSMFCKKCSEGERKKCSFLGQFKKNADRVACTPNLIEVCRDRFNIKNLILDDLNLDGILCRDIRIPKTELDESGETFTRIKNICKSKATFIDANNETVYDYVDGEKLCNEIKIAFSDLPKDEKLSKTALLQSEAAKELSDEFDRFISDLARRDDETSYNLIHFARVILEEGTQLDTTDKEYVISYKDDILTSDKFEKIKIINAVPSLLDQIYITHTQPDAKIIKSDFDYDNDNIKVIQVRDGYYPTQSLKNEKTFKKLQDAIRNYINLNKARGYKNDNILIELPKAIKDQIKTKAADKPFYFFELGDDQLIHYYGSATRGVNKYCTNNIIIAIGMQLPTPDAFLTKYKTLVDATNKTELQNVDQDTLISALQIDVARCELLNAIGRSRLWTETKDTKEIIIFSKIPLEPELRPIKMTTKEFIKWTKRERKKLGSKSLINAIILKFRKLRSKTTKLDDVARDIADETGYSINRAKDKAKQLVRWFNIDLVPVKEGRRGRPALFIVRAQPNIVCGFIRDNVLSLQQSLKPFFAFQFDANDPPPTS